MSEEQEVGLSPETQALIASLVGGAGTAMPDVLGTYTPKELSDDPRLALSQFDNDSTRLNSPYREGSSEAMFRQMPLELRVQMQQTLKAMGFISGDVYWGEVGDPNTIKGFDKLLKLSNASGTRWTSTLKRLQSRNINFSDVGGRGSGGGGPKLPAFAPPDAASLRQFAKQGISQALGREVQDDEMPDFLAQLNEDYRAEYDAQITQMQGGTAADVDPQARFAEMIESKYANELSLLDQRDDNAAGVAMAQQQTSFIDRVLGGV